MQFRDPTKPFTNDEIQFWTRVKIAWERQAIQNRQWWIEYEKQHNRDQRVQQQRELQSQGA